MARLLAALARLGGWLLVVAAGRWPARAELLLWDAPFLPVSPVDAPAVGLSLGQCRRAPFGVRAAVALQLLAAVDFLTVRGWYPQRRLLRGAQVVRGEAGVAVTLLQLPRWRLEDQVFRTPSRRRVSGADALVGRLLLPLLVRLLPERREQLHSCVEKALPGETTRALCGVIRGCGRTGAWLAHRDGCGRALWARRLHLPCEGVVWVEEEGLVPRLAAAALLARATGAWSGLVVAGQLDESDVAREQGRAAAAGAPLLVLTTLPVPGSVPLALAPEEGAVWVLPAAVECAAAHAREAQERSGGRARLAAELLAAGARDGFSAPPGAYLLREDHHTLASPAARAALATLAAFPIGLDAAECRSLGISQDSCAELLRLGLVVPYRGRWRVTRPWSPASLDERREDLVTVVPAESLAGMVVHALARGEWHPLQGWCRERLSDEEGALEVLALARALPPGSPLALWGAQAALGLGRLREAGELLAAVSEAERDGAWYALEAWRALLEGSPQRAADALGAAGELAERPDLAARCALVAAELANARGDGAEERRLLDAAARHGPAFAAEAALYCAALEDGAALRRLRRREGSGWARPLRVRYLHLLGLDAFRRDALVAVGTPLRAALRTASGLNPLMMGEVCADLATLHLARNLPALAERFYELAESYLDRAGAQRTLLLVRANRAVVANDRMRWRQAQELLARAAPSPGAGGALDEAANAVELARCELVRGRLDHFRALLPRLEAVTGANPHWLLLARAVSSLRLQLALAEGELAAAAEVLPTADDSERALAEAMLAAQQGREPDPALPPRWGIALCASILAAWRRGEREVARERAARHLTRLPQEGAVALARLVRLLARSGERLDSSWGELIRRAETTLREAELDGWAAVFSEGQGGDPLALVQALVGALTAGTACVEATFLAPLARALGVTRVEVRRGDDLLGAWGEGEAGDGSLATAGVTVRWCGGSDPLTRAALEGVARLAGTAGELEGEHREVGRALVGRSAALRRLRERIARWGPLPFPVLITGEPGTGKELVARELHRASGRRGAFLPVNCAALPAPILERELFGTVRGAFTGAEADREGLVEAAEGGTLFLDEIGELPLELQAKLLRLLQEREVRRLGSTRVRVVDVRFIAATNRDLEGATARGEFRSDLYYRLAAAVIPVPPLRQRPEDIEELAVLFCQRAAGECQREGVRLSPAAVDVLRRGRWPGNARELEWAIRRAVVEARPGEVLGPERFSGATVMTPPPLEPFVAARERFLRQYFQALLAACGGNRSEAARRAGLTRQGLLYHLRSLGLPGE